MTSSDRAIELYEKIVREIKNKGYYLNPDKEFVLELLEGMIANEKRYGYMSCPCRLASGKEEEDRDIICPCDYRDDDVAEYGACYCALYVDEDIHLHKKSAGSIPERRGTEQKKKGDVNLGQLPYPVYRCKVCGYLMAKDHPPNICPICGVDKDRFERFL